MTNIDVPPRKRRWTAWVLGGLPVAFLLEVICVAAYMFSPSRVLGALVVTRVLGRRAAS